MHAIEIAGVGSRREGGTGHEPAHGRASRLGVLARETAVRDALRGTGIRTGVPVLAPLGKRITAKAGARARVGEGARRRGRRLTSADGHLSRRRRFGRSRSSEPAGRDGATWTRGGGALTRRDAHRVVLHDGSAVHLSLAAFLRGELTRLGRLGRRRRRVPPGGGGARGGLAGEEIVVEGGGALVTGRSDAGGIGT